MGGTFNPPHNGHLHAAQQAVQALHFDRLLLIPDNIPPHKTMPEHSATSAQRLDMTRWHGGRNSACTGHGYGIDARRPELYR